MKELQAFRDAEVRAVGERFVWKNTCIARHKGKTPYLYLLPTGK